MELRKLINIPDFTCVKREDRSVLVDAKTKHNAQIVDKLFDIKGTTSRDTRMNSTLAMNAPTDYEVEPFLSLEAELNELCSSEVFQSSKKRKPHEAFLLSPTNNVQEMVSHLRKRIADRRVPKR